MPCSRERGEDSFFRDEGFGDLLRIGDQRRPDLFELGIRKRQPLHESVFEVEERLNAEGKVLAELDEAALFEQASSCIEEGITTGAIGFSTAIEILITNIGRQRSCGKPVRACIHLE